jgi:ribosomal protein S18 acetylase RimI-like enzyme
MLGLSSWLSPVRLGPADLDQILSLHNRLHALQTRPGLFALETQAFFVSCLSREGEIYGVKDDGRLVAYGVLGLPHPLSPYNFGAWVGLHPSRHGQVAHVDGAGVDPDYQGQGLQRKLIARRLEASAARGRKLVYSTAAPDNHASLRNLLKQGFRIIQRQRLFGGHDRYILQLAQCLPENACQDQQSACLEPDPERVWTGQMACESEHQVGAASRGREHWRAGSARQMAVAGAFGVRLSVPLALGQWLTAPLSETVLAS